MLSLAVEIVRYKSNRKAYEDRICVNCDTNEVEDLFHFICKCSVHVYSQIRNSNIPMMNTLNLPQVKFLVRCMNEANAIGNIHIK